MNPLLRKLLTFHQHLVFVGAIMLLGTASATAAGLQATQLRCEFLDNPLGLDTTMPRLSWVVESGERGQKQTAYQIFVAGSEAGLMRNEADLWDSGQVKSSDTLQVYYRGKALTARQQAFWKVRVWDKDGNTSESQPARWEMGLLQAADWQAKWIARTEDTSVSVAPLFRRPFLLDGQVKQARAFISGLGYFELYLNGRRAGNHLLDPAYTRYDKRVLYVTHDVTDLLKSGPNCAGVILGNGWFNVSNKAAWDFDQAPWRAAPKFICQIEVEYTDGRRKIVPSDSSWLTADSPIIYNSIYGGETYDARREIAGWDDAGFKDYRWTSAKVVAAPAGKLLAQRMPPIRATKELPPVSVTEPKPGVFVFDFGQNLSGHVRLQVRGPAGASVSMKYAERLAKDGTVDQADIATHVLRFGSNQVFQTDTYILKGGKTEEWNSRFSYFGFRYVEVAGFPGRPGKEALTAVFFHSDVPKRGEFACSNPLLNRILELTRWSYLGNLHGIPTDCPHREKNGWTGDAHLAAEQAMFNYFPAAVYRKWLNDLADEQQPDGRLPGIVPTSGWGYKWGNGPAWDSALLLIPYYQYVYYGDAGVIYLHYDSMKRYVDYLASRATNGIVKIGLNDWAPWKTKTEAGITDTAYYYVDTKILAAAAQMLGKKADATKYEKLANSIRAAFNKTFYHADTGLYDNGSQTALSCALYQGLVEPQNKARVLTNLLAAVEKTDYHIDTGILGAKYLLNTLLENGRADVAYRIVNQRDQPGWGWWIEQGATTLWEKWDGSASRFHVMYGDVAAWFYKSLAGIVPDPKAPGFKHFTIAPQVVGDLTSARADYDSIRGKIVSDWKVEKGEFRLNVTIPANTTATVSLPIESKDLVWEGSQWLADSKDVKFVRLEGKRCVVEASSGTYQFHGPLAR